MAGITGDDLLPDDFIPKLDSAIAKSGALDVQLEELANTLRNEVSKGFGELRKELKSVGLGSADAAKKLAQLEARILGLKRNSQEYEKELKKLRTANSAQSKQLTELKAKYESLSTAQRSNTQVVSRASNSIGQLVQRYAGLTAGILLVERSMRMISQQVRAAVESNISLEQAMKEVQAISRATSAQMKALTADADRLGATTEKTAQEVAGLQKELAKLGFNPAEIIASADAILDLSTATGEDLVNSATVSAATLRAFGLQATEMSRVVDVMAGSFVRSGLDLEKFRESMKLVAPIARAANIEIEVTTASLSKLADAGLSGSLAGTALRNLISEMADPTSDLAQRLGFVVDSSDKLIEAFRKLKGEGVTLAEAVQMVDVRARPAFFTIMNNIDAVDALTKEYRSLTGEGERIATLMRDTLANDIEIAESAFDAMRRGLVEGWTPALRDAAQGLATLSEGIRLMNAGSISVTENWGALGYVLRSTGMAIDENLKILGRGFSRLATPFTAFFEGAGTAIEKAKLAEEFRRIGDEVASSMEAVQKSAKLSIDFKPMIAEFRELSNVTDKSNEQMVRMATIRELFEREFGMTALMVDRETQAVSLNTAELERQITAKESEAKTIYATNTARVQEIKSRLQLLELETRTLTKNKNLNDSLVRYSEIQKEVIVLNVELGMKLPFQELANGWSVLTEEGRKYLELQKDIVNATEKTAEAQYGYAIAVAKLEEQRAKIALDNTEDEVSRMAMAEKYMNARLRLLEIEAKAEEASLEDGEENADKRRALEVKTLMAREAILNEYYNTLKVENRKIADLNKAAQEEYLKSVEETGKKLLDYTKKLNQERADAEKALQAELARIGGINDTEYTKAAEELSRISADRVIADYQSELRYSQMTLRARRAMHMGIIEAHKERAAAGKLLTAEEAASLEESLKAIGDIASEQAQRISDAFSQALQGASAIMSEMYRNASVARENELAEVEAAERRKTELAGDNIELQVRAEHEAAQERKRIRRDEAQAEKEMALFNIAINTAQGIMAALAKANPILAGVVAATGLAQSLIVSSRELPAYAVGTENAKGGPSWVGEEGRELVYDKKLGKTYLTPDKATLVNLSKGSVVKTANETDKILKNLENGDENRKISGTLRDLRSDVRGVQHIDQASLENAFEKAVKKIPVTTMNYDKHGYSVYQKRVDHTKKILNKKHGIR